MARQTQDSMLLVGVIAGGITLAAFLILLVLFDFAFSPALFVSLLVGVIAALILFRGFHDKAEPTAQAAAAPAPSAPAPVPATEPTPDPAPAPAPAPEPAAMEDARDGGADDLKKLKGVGPGLEQKLHDAGVTTFAQIAAWGPEDIAEMDEKLSFKGRIERDGWVAQAKELAGES